MRSGFSCRPKVPGCRLLPRSVGWLQTSAPCFGKTVWRLPWLSDLYRGVQDGGGRAERRAPRATLFHGQRPPLIGVAAYLKRISKYAKCSLACFAMAFSYMERAAQVRSVL